MTIALPSDTAAFLVKVAPDLVDTVAAHLRFCAPEAALELIFRVNAWRDEKRSALDRSESEVEGGWKPTTQNDKEKSGILLAIRDGKKVLVTANSFHRHLIERFLLSHPIDGPAKRGRVTSTVFKKQQELPDAIPGS
jgi:hypothetical protein